MNVYCFVYRKEKSESSALGRNGGGRVQNARCIKVMHALHDALDFLEGPAFADVQPDNLLAVLGPWLCHVVCGVLAKGAW